MCPSRLDTKWPTISLPLNRLNKGDTILTYDNPNDKVRNINLDLTVINKNINSKTNLVMYL